MAARMHVGTGFGDADSPTRAILRLALSADGTLSAGEPIPVTAGESPGWLSSHEQTAYVGFEDNPGLLQAYSIGANGALEPKGAAVSSVGRHPCQLALDATAKWLFAANYSEGSVSVCPILADGSLGPATDSKKHQGGDLIDSSLHDRQEAAHCHALIPHPSNAWVAVCDLGLSTVFMYGFDAARGTLAGAADDPRHLRCPANAGCRHACWGAAGKLLYVCNELDCTVTVARFDAATGALTAVQTVAALPEGVPPLRAHHRGGSDIHLHPNGKWLYVGMRSPDPCRGPAPRTPEPADQRAGIDLRLTHSGPVPRGSGLIAIFAVGEDGMLAARGHEPTRGLVPRNFKLVAGGAFLVVGNQESKTVVSFHVDAESGALRFASELSTAPYKPCNVSPHAFTARLFTSAFS